MALHDVAAEEELLRESNDGGRSLAGEGSEDPAPAADGTWREQGLPLRQRVMRSAGVGLALVGCLCLAAGHVSRHSKELSPGDLMSKSSRDLALVDGGESTSPEAPRKAQSRPWSSFWPLAEASQSLGAGKAVHARGLMMLRGYEGGSACLHAEKGFGAGVFMGPCEESSLTQQWQFDAKTGQLIHEFAGCLDAGGDTLHMWSCDAENPSQRWSHDEATGALKNPDRKICLDAQMLGARGDQGFGSECDGKLFTQKWGLGVRIGQVLLWSGGCLGVDPARLEAGAEVGSRSCGDRRGGWWQFTPSTGQLQLRNSSLCAVAKADTRVHLGECKPGAYEPKKHWVHDVLRGSIQVNAVHCIDGSDKGVKMEDCSNPGVSVSQRWSTGVRTGQLQHRFGLCLHSGSSDSANSVFVGACEGAREQQWSYDDRSGKIQHLSGFCLVMGPQGVSVDTCRDDLWGQQWIYDIYTNRIKHGNQCLEAPQPNTREAKVALSPCNMDNWKQVWDMTLRQSVTAIFTVETRDTDKEINMHGVPGRMLRNVGFGVGWHGFKTKVDSYQKAMEKWAKHSPEDVVILTDTDVAYGGCGEEELLRRYNTVVRESGGASIVASADANQFPPLKDGVARFQRLRRERNSVLTSFGLDRDSLDQYCARDWNGTVPIAINYAFLNSGFIMGPVKDLTTVLSCMQIEGWDKKCVAKPWCGAANQTRRKVAGSGTQCCFDDQRALSRCALKHTNKITIDYTGMIMMTTYGMHNMFEVKPDRIYNTISNSTQCFVHANCWDWSQPMKWDAWLDKLKDVFKGAV